MEKKYVMVKKEQGGLGIYFSENIENAIVAAGEATNSTIEAAGGLLLSPREVDAFVEKYSGDDDEGIQAIVRVVESARLIGHVEGCVAAMRVFGNSFGFRFYKEQPEQVETRVPVQRQLRSGR